MFYKASQFFLNHFFAAPRRGNFRDVLTIALPMLLSMSFDTLMTFVSRLFLAKLGPEYMNAALAGGSSQIVVMTFFNGVIAYSTAQVAQNFGAEKFENCSKSVAQAIWIAIICSPLVLLFRPFIYWMYANSGVEGIQLEAQILYFNTLLYGAVFILFRQVFVSFFSGIGRTKIIMIAALCGMVVNIFSNYVLIFGVGPFPTFGILGAAYGTILGNAVTVAILAFTYYSKSIRQKFGFSFRFHKRLFTELLRRGSASGAEMFLCMLAFQTLILLFHGRSEVVATAATMMFNWDMVAYVPLLGLEVAATSLSGRYVGSKDSAAVRRSIRSGIEIGIGFSLIVAVFFVGFPELLVDIFKPDAASTIFEEARPIAIMMLRLASIYILVEVGLVIFAGALRGAGDTFWVMCAMVILNWLSVLFLWICCYVLKLGPIACWLSVVIMFCIFPIVLFFRFRSGSWRRLIKTGI